MKNQYLPIPTKPFNFMSVLGHVFAIAVVNAVVRFRQDLGICDSARLVRVSEYQKREKVITETKKKSSKLESWKKYYCSCGHAICYTSTHLERQSRDTPQELCDAFQNKNFLRAYKSLNT